MEGLAPGDQVRLHPLGAIGHQRVGPHRPALQIPAQLLRLNRPERGDQPPHLLTHHLRLAGAGGLVDQAGAGGGAAHAVLLLEAEVAEFQHQLRHRLRPGLGHRRPVGGEAQAQGDEEVVEGGRGAAGTAAHRDVGGLFLKQTLQHSKPGAIEGKGNDRKLIATSLALNLDSVLHLLPHPARLQRLRAHQHGQARRSLNRCRDVTPERITTLELARIDPHRLTHVRQFLPQLPHEAIVGAAVGKKEAGHRRIVPGWSQGNRGRLRKENHSTELAYGEIRLAFFGAANLLMGGSVNHLPAGHSFP